MIYSKLKQILKGRLARFSASTSLDQYLVAELNAMMGELEEEGFIPWFLYTRADIALDLSRCETEVPVDYARSLLTSAEDPRESFMQRRLSTGKYIGMQLLPDNPINLGLITVEYSNPTTPTAYFVDEIEQKIYFNAWVNEAFQFRFEYVKVGDRYTDEPDGSEEPLWAKHVPGYIVAAAGLRIATMYIKNPEAAQMFMADAQRERTKMIHKHTAIMEARYNPNTVN